MLDVSHVRTQRLLMRRWRDTDLEPFRAMNADPEVMRHFPAPLDREASDRLVERFERHFDEHSWGVWALEESRTGRFLGFTGLNPLPDGVPGAGEPEVGWRLARHAWHQGVRHRSRSRRRQPGRRRVGDPGGLVDHRGRQ
jgi:RimJ/RimL family protein N-acetyltransferase